MTSHGAIRLVEGVSWCTDALCTSELALALLSEAIQAVGIEPQEGARTLHVINMHLHEVCTGETRPFQSMCCDCRGWTLAGLQTLQVGGPMRQWAAWSTSTNMSVPGPPTPPRTGLQCLASLAAMDSSWMATSGTPQTYSPTPPCTARMSWRTGDQTLQTAGSYSMLSHFFDESFSRTVTALSTV